MRSLLLPVIIAAHVAAFPFLGWMTKVHISNGLTVELAQEFREIQREPWRQLVEEHFEPDDVDRALRVIECESKGRVHAKNPHSTATGLFQHLRSMWPERSARAGIPGADIFDPEAQATVAAWLVYDYGGWKHWNASRSCWRR